ncbi:hypothetical protein Y1Q_0018959 [Alligator mississippiensis]|uniref:Uncharacterized protein n=1 Tax=Alligator mississippiensis TaxID=8496 RepID=A0A151M3A4_ALLMI|nr:hypothetical protein Y1Q_0018959 [Alligator mississippiensis]
MSIYNGSNDDVVMVTKHADVRCKGKGSICNRLIWPSPGLLQRSMPCRLIPTQCVPNPSNKLRCCPSLFLCRKAVDLAHKLLGNKNISRQLDAPQMAPQTICFKNISDIPEI